MLLKSKGSFSVVHHYIPSNEFAKPNVLNHRTWITSTRKAIFQNSGALRLLACGILPVISLTKLLYYLHDRCNRSFRLVNFKVVAALLGNQLLTIG